MHAQPFVHPDVSETARSLSEGIALYIHIPFCETKCPYCDFNTYAGINHLLPAYLAALEREIRVWGDTLDHPTANTVFLGGGTPSMLSPTQMSGLLLTVRQAFPIALGAEVTAEVNPDDASIERLSAFRTGGVNRISLGVQSLDDDELRMLGRRHGANDALAALRVISDAGFTNFSVDLMYGLPHQGMDTWTSTVEGVLDAGPQHVSAYALTMEEGTPFGRQAADGLLPEQDTDLAADMYWWADEALSRAGLSNYEISNWARPGMESLHNITYWRNVPYLGVGPGAHSFLGGYRFANMNSPVGYMSSVRAWESLGGGVDVLLRERPGPVADIDPMDARTEMADSVILGLRLAAGVSERSFRKRFGVGLRDVYSDVISRNVTLGLLRVHGDGPDAVLRLTKQGRFLANEAFVRFLSA